MRRPVLKVSKGIEELSRLISELETKSKQFKECCLSASPPIAAQKSAQAKSVASDSADSAGAGDFRIIRFL